MSNVARLGPILTAGIPPLAIAFAVWLAYASSLDGQFMLDDFRVLVQPGDELRNFPEWSDWRPEARPLTRVTFAVAERWGLGGRRGMHVGNLLIHITAAWLAYAVVLRGLQRCGWQETSGLRVDITAAACAILWAVHPLTTEAVTYVVQRSESLAAMFMLATLVCWDLLSRESKRAKFFAGVAALICATLAAASKQTAVVLPALILLYDRALLSPTWKASLTHRGLWLALLTLPTLWIIEDVRHYQLVPPARSTTEATTEASSPPGPTEEQTLPEREELTRWEYLRSQGTVVWYYVWLTLTATSQSLDYDWKVPSDVATPLFSWGGWLLVLTASGLLWRQSPRLSLLPLAFLVCLSPTSTLVPIRDLAVEHRMYLPLLWLLTWGVLGIAWCWPRTAMARLCWGAVMLVCTVVLIVRTDQRNQDYSSAVRLWSIAERAAPHSPRVKTHLASALLNDPRAGDAVPTAIRALEDATASYQHPSAKPHPHISEIANAHSLLGSAYSRVGRQNDAEEQLRRAVALAPETPSFLRNLGAIRQKAGDLEEAESLYRAALRIAPNDALSHINLGRLQLARNDPAAAIESLEVAVRLQPQSALALRSLASAYEQAGRHAEAHQQYLKLEKLPAFDGSDCVSWGKFLARQQQYEPALRLFLEAGARSPQDPLPRALEAEMRAKLGDHEGSRRLCQQLLAELPADAPLAEQIRMLLRSL